MKKLTSTEITHRLDHLQGWSLNEQAMEKDFEFKDFPAAMVFMNRLVPVAEKLDHHPDWSNSYNKVHIRLTTHDSGGLTEADMAFAEAADEAADGLAA